MRSSCLFEENGKFKSKIGKVERFCERGMRVRVYRNLLRPDYFSILAMEGENKGRVCGYAKSVTLKNAKFVVSKKSRDRAVRAQQRNVHAFCEGVISCALAEPVDATHFNRAVTYNPFYRADFYDRESGKAVKGTHKIALLQGANVYLVNQLKGKV